MCTPHYDIAAEARCSAAREHNLDDTITVNGDISHHSMPRLHLYSNNRRVMLNPRNLPVPGAVISSRCTPHVNSKPSYHVYPHCDEKSSIRYGISEKSFTVELVVSDVKARSSPGEVGIESV
jgi:hypothetical protein